MLSRDEINRKCSVKCDGICDLLSGHDGPHRSANGYILRAVRCTGCPGGCVQCDTNPYDRSP